MKKFVLGFFLTITFTVTGTAMEYASNTIIFSGTFNIGTFSAGEYYGGSIFLGGSISTDWIPN
jgi:hypothetical protein